MGICWDCYWGWPKAVADIYDAAEQDEKYYSVLHFGPSHIVWEDENWEDSNIQFCLEYAKEKENTKNYSKEEMDICIWSLNELLKIPYEERSLEPEDYDDEHPENYPPPKGSVMVKR